MNIGRNIIADIEQPALDSRSCPPKRWSVCRFTSTATGDPSRAGSKEKALDHPLYLLLHDEPNPEMTSFTFRETLMGHLLLWSNAYAQIIRNGKGEVMSLYPLMPNMIQVDRDNRDELYYLYNRTTEDARLDEGKPRQVYLTPSDVLHIPGWPWHGYSFRHPRRRTR